MQNDESLATNQKELCGPPVEKHWSILNPKVDNAGGGSPLTNIRVVL